MPIVNRLADFHDEITEWRREFHEDPEILYEVHNTAKRVEMRLREFGVDEVVTGIGKTGVVGTIQGKSNVSGKVIGLRSDMDALPIVEKSGKPYASKTEGKMHACGHDGHMAMLLGAAKYLAETRNFDGKIVLIFQPAEEGGAGGKAMIDDGLMEKFGIQEVYGMHNFPGIPEGTFAIRSGGIMAATDEYSIEVTGVGGHAALPHLSIDPVIISAHIVLALQSLISRNLDPIESAVHSTTVVKVGEASNVIAKTATIKGTVRTLDEGVRKDLLKRIEDMVPQLAASFGGSAKVEFWQGYPVTHNWPDQTKFCGDVAAEIVGEDRVNREVRPTMGAEDFSYMLQEKPGAFIFLGQGDTPMLHEDSYDFNDEIIPIGCSYWVKLVETALPVSP